MVKYRLIYDDNGQTCNRFWGYLDSVSWAILNRKKVIILYWDRNIKYFTPLRKSPYVSFPLYSEWIVKHFGDEKARKYVLWIVDNIFFHWFFNNFKTIFGLVQIVRGWSTRNMIGNHQKVGQFVYDQFLPNEDIIYKVDQVFDKRRTGVDTIVGVHIRKGDYKYWLDGRYYYEDEAYESFMSQMETLLAPRKVSFFISTNGEVSDIITKNHQTFRIEQGNMAHDLYGLSCCDYIMGPPSTFSKWAALVGNVPLCHIGNSNQQLTLDDFSYSVALSPWEK